MRIEWINIKGFRNFDNETIHFADKSLIIGANDVGKTNLIYALRLLFDRSINDRDLELTDSDYNAYTKATSIEITVAISKITECCLKSVFIDAIKDGATFIRYTNSKGGDYSILSGPTTELLEVKPSRFYLKRLNMEYVDTNRDLFLFLKRERIKLLEISKTGLADTLLEEDKSSISRIQKDLDNINSRIDCLHYIKASLEVVNTELSKLSIHNEDQNVRFVTGNSDVDTMLDNLDLAYSAMDAPLNIGGDGRNNQIFLATWISKQNIQKSVDHVTIFAIEEPEAHLHPHQQRKLSKYLTESFDEQVFITTHSPQIAAEFTPKNIIRIYSKNKISMVAQGGCSNKLSLTFDDFGYRLNAISSEVFFSDGIFLVEGPSEKLFYTALAQEIGIDLDRLNLTILAVDGVGFKSYIKVCKALEIPFVLRTDNDIFEKTSKGKTYYYFAGISRAINIYKKLIASSEDDELVKYWEVNCLKNEWAGEKNGYPKSALVLNNAIRRKLKPYNIFLSLENLEDDLVQSELFGSLSDFYDESNKDKLIIKMQKRKAENMLDYLKNKHSDLNILKDKNIALPLLTIKSLIEKVVHPRGRKIRAIG